MTASPIELAHLGHVKPSICKFAETVNVCTRVGGLTENDHDGRVPIDHRMTKKAWSSLK